MKAVGYRKSLPVEAADSLIDFEAAKPEPKGRDIRVAVEHVADLVRVLLVHARERELRESLGRRGIKSGIVGRERTKG